MTAEPLSRFSDDDEVDRAHAIGFREGFRLADERAERLRAALEDVRDQPERLAFYIARDAISADDAARGEGKSYLDQSLEMDENP